MLKWFSRAEALVGLAWALLTVQRSPHHQPPWEDWDPESIGQLAQCLTV
ncbi:MAG: hypothetical protein AAF889_07125 [Cyanobacteria bacterium P01_D01_bin.73]